MAKRKTTPKPDLSTVQVVHLKGTMSYRDWLASLSRETLIPVASIVRDALRQWAAAKGLPAPPER